jgi:hypothetical protein
MKKSKSAIILIILLSFNSLLIAQTVRMDSTWLPLSYFVGNWKGTGEAGGMKGAYERSYQSVFNGRFIEARNKSVFSPTEKNPRGEVHEDLGYFSYDKNRKLFILRQFHVEGFVNQYRLDTISSNGKTIVFATESIENIPLGWKAKETYQLISTNEFIETFELAEPGKAFEVYSKVRLMRQKDD